MLICKNKLTIATLRDKINVTIIIQNNNDKALILVDGVGSKTKNTLFIFLIWRLFPLKHLLQIQAWLTCRGKVIHSEFIHDSS